MSEERTPFHHTESEGRSTNQGAYDPLRIEELIEIRQLAAKSAVLPDLSADSTVSGVHIVPQENQVALESFANNLLTKEYNRFKNIFRTSSGSLYFVLHSGHCLRLDCSDPKTPRYNPQRIFPHIMFVSPQVKAEIRTWTNDFKNLDGIKGHPIQTSAMKVGASPIEFDEGEETDYSRVEPDRILEHSDVRHIKHIALHIGNEITEILK